MWFQSMVGWLRLLRAVVSQYILAEDCSYSSHSSQESERQGGARDKQQPPKAPPTQPSPPAQCECNSGLTS